MEQFHTSVTERAQFRNCRRRWYYQNVELLQRGANPQWALIFGKAMHSALEAYYTTIKLTGDRSLVAALAAFELSWSETDDELAETMSSVYTMGIDQEWYDYWQLGQAMLKNYDEYDRKSQDWVEVIDVALEERAFVEIPYVKVFPGNKPPLISGQIDLAVRKADGTVWIWDHKNLKDKPSYGALELDDQITGYMWLYWKLTGIIPRGFMYNALIKRVPTYPKINKNGLPSTDKRQYTTYDIYLKAIQEHGMPKDGEAMLAELHRRGWSDYFDRTGTTRSEKELLSFERRIGFEYYDMVNAIEFEGARYPNPSKFNCATCPVMSICKTLEEQGDVDAVIELQYTKADPRVQLPTE